MENVRPTAMVRELLLRKMMLEMIKQEAKKATWSRRMLRELYERIESELTEVRRKLNGSAVFIIEEEWRQIDVYVQFKHNGLIKDAEYMLPMLEAEAAGRLNIMKVEYNIERYII